MSKNTLIIFCTVLILAALGVNALFTRGAYHHTDSEGVVNCQEVEKLKAALRETIEETSRFTQSSHVRSDTEKAGSEVYYNHVLNRFEPRHCPHGPPPAHKRKKAPHAGTVRQETHRKQ